MIACLKIFLFLLVASVPAFATGMGDCPMTPENPSLILFLAGSAAMGYQYLRARFY